MVATLIAPTLALAAPTRATNAKSVSLRLTDVTRVLGHNISAGPATCSKPHAMGASNFAR